MLAICLMVSTGVFATELEEIRDKSGKTVVGLRVKKLGKVGLDDLMLDIKKNYPEASKLDFCEAEMSSDDLVVLGKHLEQDKLQLKEVYLNNNAFYNIAHTNAFIESLAHNQSLEKLMITGIPEKSFGSMFMQKLIEQKRSTSLQIVSFVSTVNKLTKAAEPTNFDEGVVDLSKHKIGMDQYLKRTFVQRMLFTGAKKNKLVRLAGSDTTGTGLRSLPVHLKSLDLSDCRNITNEGLKNIQHLTNLTYLNLLNNPRITREVLKYLTSIRNLKVDYDNSTTVQESLEEEWAITDRSENTLSSTTSEDDECMINWEEDIGDLIKEELSEREQPTHYFIRTIDKTLPNIEADKPNPNQHLKSYIKPKKKEKPISDELWQLLPAHVQKSIEGS